MADDVGERLLEDAEERSGHLRLQQRLVQAGVYFAFDAGARLEFVRLPFDRRHQSQIIQYARPQFSGDPPDGLNGGIHARDERFDGLWPGPLAGQPRQVQLQAGKRLAQFVVDFTGDARALLFADGLQVGGQRAQLLVRFPELALRAFAFGAFLGFAQGSMHGGNQSLEPIFDDVVGRAILERLNRHLLAHCAGDEDEGDIRRFLAGNGQGRQTVERRQRVVREDQIRRMFRQLANEVGSPLYASGHEAQAAFAQRQFVQLGIRVVVLQHQDVNRLRHSLRLSDPERHRSRSLKAAQAKACGYTVWLMTAQNLPTAWTTSRNSSKS